MAKGEDECNICHHKLRSINGRLLCPLCDTDILVVLLKAERRQPTEKAHKELLEENKMLKKEVGLYKKKFYQLLKDSRIKSRKIK